MKKTTLKTKATAKKIKLEESTIAQAGNSSMAFEWKQAEPTDIEKLENRRRELYQYVSIALTLDIKSLDAQIKSLKGELAKAKLHRQVLRLRNANLANL